MSDDPVRSFAPLSPVDFLPEMRLHQAAESVDLWAQTGGGFRSDQPPPFWAFVWPGGLGLARFVLDRPETVAGLRVLDLGAGSGVVAIAAALAGAAHVRALDRDPHAVAAIEANAAANGVTVRAEVAEAGARELAGADVVLAGDMFYQQDMSGRMTSALRLAVRDGVRVLVGDPGRGFLPRALFTELAAYDVPARPALEDVTGKRTTIWQLRPPAQPASS